MSAIQIITLCVDDLRAIVREEMLRASAGTSPGAAKELLSKRAAAKLLGVDRGTTLEELLRAGILKTVDIGGRPRILRSELARVLAEGFEVPKRGRHPRAPKRPRGSNALPDVEAMRRFDLSKL